jgi:hypothetical protein
VEGEEEREMEKNLDNGEVGGVNPSCSPGQAPVLAIAPVPVGFAASSIGSDEWTVIAVPSVVLL